MKYNRWLRVLLGEKLSQELTNNQPDHFLADRIYIKGKLTKIRKGNSDEYIEVEKSSKDTQR